MLQSVRVQRFKSVADANVPLGPVTLLVGPNNAGKSSFLHAIQFAVSVAQSLRLDNVSIWNGEDLSGSLSAQQLVYTPLRDVHALAAGGNLRQDANQAIEVTLTTSDLGSATVQVRRGRNKNIAVAIEGGNLGRRLENIENPYSVVAPGLAGIPAFEEFRSPGIVQRAAAKGDANGVFRNVLWLLKQRQAEWELFQNRLGTIFAGLQIDVEFDSAVDEIISARAISAQGNLPIDSCGTGVLQAIQTLSYIGVYKPKVLILDEPDSHLHPDNQRRLARLLHDIAHAGITQVVISTHSRHFLDEFAKLDATVHWFSGGQVHHDNNSRVDVLLGLGALDAGDRLRNGRMPLVVLTEDSHTDNLKKVLQSSGLGDDVCDVWSYSGCSNVQSAIVLGNFIREHAPGTRVLVHRDRDYMTDAAATDYSEKLTAAGLHVFLTPGTDVESIFLNVAHILSIVPDLDHATVQRLLEEATADCRPVSVERCINHWLTEAQRTRNRGGAEPNAGRIAADANAAYDQNTSRYQYGKRVLGVLASKLQQTLGRNVALSQSTAALNLQTLRDMAELIRHVD